MSEQQDVLVTAFLVALCLIMWLASFYMARTMQTDETRETEE